MTSYGTGPQRMPWCGGSAAAMGDRDRDRSISGLAVVLGSVLRIAQQVVGGDELLQLRVTGRATRFVVTRVGVQIPQPGTKRVVDVCRGGVGAHPQHSIGIE